jgi:hypothetical protein
MMNSLRGLNAGGIIVAALILVGCAQHLYGPNGEEVVCSQRGAFPLINRANCTNSYEAAGFTRTLPPGWQATTMQERLISASEAGPRVGFI